MTASATLSTSTQLQKVKRVSRAIRMLLQIGLAFMGIGLAIALFGVTRLDSQRLDIGEGEFKIGVFGDGDKPRPTELLIVQHRKPNRDDRFYQPIPPAGLSASVVYQESPPGELTATVHLSPTLRLCLGFMALLNGALMMQLLWQLVTLFQHYERGEVFNKGVVQSLQASGYALLAFPVVAIINSFAAAVLVATVAPELDYFSMTIKFDLLFAAAVVLVIAWIMDIGRQLQEETALTI